VVPHVLLCQPNVALLSYATLFRSRTRFVACARCSQPLPVPASGQHRLVVPQRIELLGVHQHEEEDRTGVLERHTRARRPASRPGWVSVLAGTLWPWTSSG